MDGLVCTLCTRVVGFHWNASTTAFDILTHLVDILADPVLGCVDGNLEAWDLWTHDHQAFQLRVAEETLKHTITLDMLLADQDAGDES